MVPRIHPRWWQWCLLIGCSLGALSCANTGFRFKGAAANDAPSLLSGTIETRETRVGSKVGGRVAAVLVEEGQSVSAGQVLVRFEIAELQAELAQAQAAVEQSAAQLAQLQNGARPAEVEQARAVTANAQAAYDAVSNGPRVEEIAQARAALAAATAEAESAALLSARYEQLQRSGDIARQDFDAARLRMEQLQARRAASQQQLDLLRNGSRAEDVRASAERLRVARASEHLVRSGPRVESITDAQAQWRQALARVEQLKVRLTEGEVRAPAAAIVEALTVRPGDLLTPNQNVARLLEHDQLFVRVYVPEPQLGWLNVGQRAQVKVDSFADRQFAGKIEQINGQGEFTPRNVQSRDARNHQVFGVKVRLDNRAGLLKSGMAAEVWLDYAAPAREATNAAREEK